MDVLMRKTPTSTVREEHISLVAEPNVQYVGHIALSSGSAYVEATAIFEFIVSQLTVVDSMRLVILTMTGRTPMDVGRAVSCEN